MFTVRILKTSQTSFKATLFTGFLGLSFQFPWIVITLNERLNNLYILALQENFGVLRTNLEYRSKGMALTWNVVDITFNPPEAKKVLFYKIIWTIAFAIAHAYIFCPYSCTFIFWYAYLFQTLNFLTCINKCEVYIYTWKVSNLFFEYAYLFIICIFIVV